MKLGDLVYDPGVGLLGILVRFNPDMLFPCEVMYSAKPWGGDVFFSATTECQLRVISSACNTEVAVV